MNLASVLADPYFPALKRFVLTQTGLAYYTDKDGDLAARLMRRMNSLHAPNCQTYLKKLEDALTGAHEMECLVGDLTVGETYFFRQVEHFDILRNTILPALIDQNAESRRIRIWSAGCATGEEPYSIAILLERDFGVRLAGWDVSILASDINSEFLARAKEARYTNWAFRATPHEIREQCFDRRGNVWALRPAYRKRVTFQRLNFAAEQTMAAFSNMFDLIVCRNVMIYFAAELIQKTVARFWEALIPGGWLIVGHAEFNPVIYTQFVRVTLADASVYQKPGPGVPAVEPEGWGTLRDFSHDLPPRKKRATARSVETPVPVAKPSGPTLEEVRHLADRGSWQTAASQGRHLAKREPLNAAVHFTLGLILEHIGSPPEAEQALRQAIYLDRAFALAHYHLAICLQGEGKEGQARKSLQNVVQLLKNRAEEERIEHGDGMTVADLREMAKLHLEVLGARESAR